MNEVKKEHYKSLDGIRGVAALAIVLMHIHSNTSYSIHGFVADQLIPSLTNFTYLFMMISAFSLCCGYYTKVQTGTIDFERFYIRRYQRIWPFFAFLCTLDLIIEPSINTLYQYLADLTLAFGFIPNNQIEVVGVGWFLGVIFIFYMIFPFFCFLLKTKKRAWLTLGITVLLHFLCDIYFKDARGNRNFIYCAMFFMGGGLVYLYRKDIETIITSNKKYLVYSLLAISIALFFVFNKSEYITLFVLTIMCICCLRPNKGGGTAEQILPLVKQY